MSRLVVCAAAFALLSIVGVAGGAVITFDEFPADNVNGPMPADRYAYLGVTFLGTDDGSTWGGISNGDPGNWDLEGTNGPIFSGYNGSSYSMTVTTGYIRDFRLDVSRSLGSIALDTFTLNGYYGGTLVESITVPLHDINVWTTVALTQNVDEVSWSGAGRQFHPYGIDNLNWNSTAVPEPTTLLIWSLLGGLGIAFGCWRRRETV